MTALERYRTRFNDDQWQEIDAIMRSHKAHDATALDEQCIARLVLIIEDAVETIDDLVDWKHKNIEHTLALYAIGNVRKTIRGLLVALDALETKKETE